jgi:hypothetical protein
MDVLDGTDGDAALAAETMEFGIRKLAPTASMDELQVTATGYDLIVIDNASDAFDGDENHRRQVRAFVRMLAQIARDNDAAVLLLMHVDKHAARSGGSGNNYSGSTAWNNSVRSRLALIAVDECLQLVHEKANFGKLADPIPLAWTDAGVLMPAKLTVPGEQGSSDADAVLLALQAAAAADADVPAGRQGPSNAQAVLATFNELPDRLRGPRGKRAFWEAVGRLMVAGRVEVRSIRGANRHEKKILAVKGALDSAAECARANPPYPLRIERAHLEGAALNRAQSLDADKAQLSAPQQSECSVADYRRASDGE